VLLDGLMTLCVTGVLYCVVRYAETVALRWLLAAGVLMGASVLSKETSVVLLGSLYAFFALTPVVRMRARHLLLAALGTAAMVAVAPAVLAGAGRAGTGQHYLLWQLFRRPNHEVIFYAGVVPAAIGPVVLVAAVAGLVWLRRENTWRERLLVCWMAVPVAFFTMWPVKGYQYLLPVAPVIAVLAARTLVRLPALPRRLRLSGSARATVVGAVVLAVASLAVPAWTHVNPRPSDRFLAGTGGLPGGREAGEWVRRHVPRGAKLLAIGPSMANVLQFYGERRAQALSVSANPRERNPSYVPVPNPDRALRDGEFQYLVWDTYTAHRSPFFADKARRLVDRYHGVAVFTSTVGPRPVIVIYQVRAS
jgi:hypothetical protein